MRKLFTVLVAVLLTASVFAQSPQKMSYQAVIRNNSGDLVTSSAIGMKISILQTSASGTAVYTETHVTTTNTNGLVSIEIGGGTPVTGTFGSIDWAAGPYFIKTETDPLGGTNYNISGTSQLLSVPYALHAKTATSITGKLSSSQLSDLQAAITNNAVVKENTAKLAAISGINTGDQDLASVAAISNSVNTQLKKVTDPTDAQDAATKAYVDALLARIEALELKNGFTDIRDINHYNAIKIGNQTWMAENLKYLPSVVGPGTGSEIAPYYFVYNYNGTDVSAAKATANYTTYGVLYNWFAAMNGEASSTANPSGVQGVCPTGWHLPSESEWTQLRDYLGGEIVAGGKLKETGTTHWKTPNTGATNETGFTGLPYGQRGYGGTFWGIGEYGEWWSSTVDSDTSAYRLAVLYGSAQATITSQYINKKVGFPVRCVKD